jgi:hypothetical protein
VRVVSLLPSATELVCALGACDRLVGRSHECDRPPPGTPDGDRLVSLPALTSQRTSFTSAADVDRQVSESLSGGQSLYDLDADRLRSLRPDVIITQDLCEVCSVDLAQVRRAAASIEPAPVVVSLDPHTIEGVFDDLMTVGRAMGIEERARAVVVGWRERMDAAASLVAPFEEPKRVLFLEWTDPPYCGGHWTPQLIERAGGEHTLNPCAPVVAEAPVNPDGSAAAPPPGPLGAERVAGKSRRVDPGEVLLADRQRPFDVVIVCPCGLSLEQTIAETRKLLAGETEAGGWFAKLDAARGLSPASEPGAAGDRESLAGARVIAVDGNIMFNRPGPGLVDAYEFLVGAVQGRPRAIPEGFPAAAYC